MSSLALLPSGVIFPLYIYPSDNCAGWAPLVSSISTHRTLQFTIIVDPASGPGSADSQPDTNYQACIAQLRSTGAANGDNVRILGYVATGHGSRTVSAVLTDIGTYNGWSAAYRPDGIFFDEAATDPSFLSNYQSFTTTVRNEFGPNSYIVLNPGAVPDTGYFSIAHLVVSFEGFYSDFSASSIPISSATPANKQAAIIHDGPTNVNLTTVRTLTRTVGVGASFLTDFPNAVAYENYPTDWTTYLNDLVSTQA
ncbi:putative spherulation-specific family 4 [Lyophyllum shimeji]|uniref:Spherulation-specific family 4 n=1 Tax=Lyophyllum shimeji TaxID=47721 RepID=A0A9P3PSR0_LYOSH|nr:putative spherulation-specific family 4 [Lyophyllum shimeji]